MNPRPDSGRPARGWRNRDHTRGSLLVSLFVLALPLVATSLAGVVFQLVDLGLISRLGEDATTAIIVSNQSLRQIVLVLAMGASFGAQGLRATTPDELRGALKRGFDTPGPTLIEVPMGEMPSPWDYIFMRRAR